MDVFTFHFKASYLIRNLIAKFHVRESESFHRDLLTRHKLTLSEYDKFDEYARCMRLWFEQNFEPIKTQMETVLKRAQVLSKAKEQLDAEIRKLTEELSYNEIARLNLENEESETGQARRHKLILLIKYLC